MRWTASAGAARKVGVAYELADSGPLSPELLAGIRRVKGVIPYTSQLSNDLPGLIHESNAGYFAWLRIQRDQATSTA
jgi:hypothetical protein